MKLERNANEPGLLALQSERILKHDYLSYRELLYTAHVWLGYMLVDMVLMFMSAVLLVISLVAIYSSNQHVKECVGCTWFYNLINPLLLIIWATGGHYCYMTKKVFRNLVHNGCKPSCGRIHWNGYPWEGLELIMVPLKSALSYLACYSLIENTSTTLFCGEAMCCDYNQDHWHFWRGFHQAPLNGIRKPKTPGSVQLLILHNHRRKTLRISSYFSPSLQRCE